MADLNVTFKNHGITAVIDETAIDIAAMHADDPGGDNDAHRFRNAVRNELFLIEDQAGSYSNAADATTFTLSCGSITIPNELIATVSKTNDEVQSTLDNISSRLVAKYPAA